MVTAIADKNDLAYLKTLSLLYVEDDNDTREQLSQMLRHWVKVVHSAENGLQGLDEFKKNTIDIVVTDIQMPIVNGLKMCEVIRKINSVVPIVITTAFEEPDYMRQSIEVGVDKYITKPIDPKQIKDALLKCARMQRAEVALREVQERYQVLFKLTSTAIAVTNHIKLPDAMGFANIGGIVIDCNDVFIRILGHQNKEDVLGLSIFELTVPIEGESERKLIETELFVNGFTREYEKTLVRSDGSTIPVMGQLILRRSESGEAMEVWSVMHDISERKLAEEKLKLSAKIVEASPNAIMISDANNLILLVNPAFTEVSGYSEDEAKGQNSRLLKSGRHDNTYYQAIQNSLATQGHWQGEIWNRRKNGEIYPEWLSISTIKTSDGSISQYISIFTDLTIYKAAEEKILYQSHYDALTNLPNRILMYDRACLALAAATRTNSNLVLMFIDLDQFKNINDSLGHNIGDRYLQEIAIRLSDNLHADDTLCRQGGDEFIVLLPNTDAEGAAHIAKNLLELISRPFNVDGRQLQLTASIGIAQFPENGTDFHRLSQSADSALFRAKANGRNNFQFFTQQMHDRANEVLAIESALNLAIEKNEIFLYYQPLIDAVTSRIIGVEALIRWQHPEWGFVPPSKFIPIAEDSGQIGKIGDWVLRTASKQNANWQAAGLSIVPVAVNLSVVQFRQSDFCEAVQNALSSNGLDPTMIELELTESITMENSVFAIDMLERLHAAGFGLSIDDFGTGYSSLAYLKRFKIDKLKIDQSFVRDINKSSQDNAIVSAIIDLAKNLGFKTIAEGVETQQQVDFLRDNHCDEFQGYYFSKPLPAKVFQELLAKGTIEGKSYDG